MTLRPDPGPAGPDLEVEHLVAVVAADQVAAAGGQSSPQLLPASWTRRPRSAARTRRWSRAVLLHRLEDRDELEAGGAAAGAEGKLVVLAQGELGAALDAKVGTRTRERPGTNGYRKLGCGARPAATPRPLARRLLPFDPERPAEARASGFCRSDTQKCAAIEHWARCTHSEIKRPARSVVAGFESVIQRGSNHASHAAVRRGARDRRRGEHRLRDDRRPGPPPLLHRPFPRPLPLTRIRSSGVGAGAGPRQPGRCAQSDGARRWPLEESAQDHRRGHVQRHGDQILDHRLGADQGRRLADQVRVSHSTDRRPARPGAGGRRPATRCRRAGAPGAAPAPRPARAARPPGAHRSRRRRARGPGIPLRRLPSAFEFAADRPPRTTLSLFAALLLAATAFALTACTIGGFEVVEGEHHPARQAPVQHHLLALPRPRRRRPAWSARPRYRPAPPSRRLPGDSRSGGESSRRWPTRRDRDAATRSWKTMPSEKPFSCALPFEQDEVDPDDPDPTGSPAGRRWRAPSSSSSLPPRPPRTGR